MRFSVTSKPVLLVAGVVLLALGVVAGLALPWDALRGRVASAVAAPADGHGGHEGHGHEGHGHEGHGHEGHGHEGHDHGGHGGHGDGGHGDAAHVDLSPTAKANLGLKTGRVKLSDYVRTLHVPGEVIEAPGYSTADVPARVAGVVTAIHVAPGQAVRPGDRLFDLDLTGEALAEAQSRLLDDLQQLARIDAELERLGPLAEGGSVAARQRLQLEYDRRRIEGQRNTRIQELLIRGLTRTQVDRIVTNRELVRSVTVLVPEFPERADDSRDDPSAATEGSVSAAPDDWQYTVEAINVHPGQNVGPEESLAKLARHTRLHVRGHAFERDVPTIAALRHGETVAVEFGGAGHGGIDGSVGGIGDDGAHGEVVDGLEILYLDNHVDPETQTYAFYVPLANEVLRDVTGEGGRVFRSWKYKPGQRVHVRVPIDVIEGRIVLPPEAVATEGPEAFVFRLAGRHTLKEKGPGGEPLRQEVYEPVPVVVSRRDRDAVVLTPGGGPLRVGDVIAMNRAYQLLLALKTAAEGGGGHHHGHEH